MINLVSRQSNSQQSRKHFYSQKKNTFLAMEFKSFILVSALFCAIFAQTYAKPTQATKKQIEFLQKNLPGEWKEDQYQRDNLSNFLYEAGLNWFKRTYATTASWENEENIKFEDGNFIVKGKRGPYAEVFNFTLHPDGSTQSSVDLGSNLGGVTDAIAELKGNSLITYLTKKGEDSVYMRAIRTIKEDTPDVMISETTIYPSKVSMTATYQRQPKEE